MNKHIEACLTCVLILCVFLFRLEAVQGEVLIDEIHEIYVDQNVWIERLAVDADHGRVSIAGFDVGSDDGIYNVYTISGKQLDKISDFVVTPTDARNPYLQRGDINIFKTVANRLFLTVQKPGGQAMVSVLNAATPDAPVEQVIKIPQMPSTPIILDDEGNFFWVKIQQDLSPSLHKISPSDSSPGGTTDNSTFQIIKVSAGIFHANSFILALTYSTQKNPQSKIIRMRTDGTIIGEQDIEGFVFKILPVNSNQFMLLVSSADPNAAAQAIIYSSDIEQVSSYKVPSFYELIDFPDSVTALADGSLLLIKRQGDMITNNGNVQLIKYSSKSSANTLAVFGSDSQVDSKVINFMKAQVDGKLYIGVLELRNPENKPEKYFKVYEISGLQ